MGTAITAQEIGNLGCLGGDLPAALVLAVQHAQGISIQPGLTILAQLLPQGRQISHQPLPVNRTAGGTTHAVNLRRHAA